MFNIDELSRVTAENVFAQFEHGDPALRQVLRQWTANEPDLAPASLADDVDRWRAFHATRIAAGGVARIYRVILVHPRHWKATGINIPVGRHWSLEEDKAFVMGAGNPPGGREYLLTTEIQVGASDLFDWPATIAANVAFGDQEYEVVLREGRLLGRLQVHELQTGHAFAMPSASTGFASLAEVSSSFLEDTKLPLPSPTR
jgi:hypothetical protein